MTSEFSNVYDDGKRAEAYAALETIEAVHPLGKEGEGCAWVSETRIAPWVIYVLGSAATAA